MLTTDPNGDVVYAAFNAGEIHRFRYRPPVASFSATPSSGPALLHVSFDGTASSAPAGLSSFDWDFGDGSAHGSGATTTHTYAGGTWTARLTVTDVNDVSATTSRTIAVSNTPPVVTLDTPTCTSDCWSVGDTIALAAHATDTEDGPLPPSAFSWHIGLEHCHSPSDCHEHDLLDPTGVASTSVVAPDHDSGSFLRITVTATDSGGLSDTATIDVAPTESMLEATSSPAGLPVTIDGQTGAGDIGPLPEIVGHVATVAAAATVTTGEDRWSFGSWSDGGAISHTVTVGAAPATLTATYTHATLDASNTCAGASTTAARGTWTNGVFGSANDVDWVRFNVASAGRYRIVLGGLPVDGTLALYRGCSTLLQTSAHPGLRWEELVASLSPGTYAIRMANASGAASNADYHWQLQAMTPGAALLSAALAPAPPGSLRFVGEVMNTSSTTRAVTVTARLYSAQDKLLKTVSGRVQIAALAKYGRSLFTIATSRPAGFARVRYSVSSVAASPTTRLLGGTGVTAISVGAGLWRVSGSIVNDSTTTASNVRYLVGIYDSSGRVLNASSGPPSRTTLTAGQSAAFSVTFGGLATTPMVSTARGKAS
jgi:PKD repeat protein